MEEKDEIIRKVLNIPAERTLRLPITIESRCTTAKGIFLQAMRRLARKSVLRHQKSLLDIAVNNSRVLSTLVCTAKSNTAHLKEQSATEITHSILSDNEEAYSLSTYHQKQRLYLLKLRLCLTGGVLTIHAEAPRFLWLQSALGQSHSNLLWYDVILASFLDAKV